VQHDDVVQTRAPGLQARTGIEAVCSARRHTADGAVQQLPPAGKAAGEMRSKEGAAGYARVFAFGFEPRLPAYYARRSWRSSRSASRRVTERRKLTKSPEITVFEFSGRTGIRTFGVSMFFHVLHSHRAQIVSNVLPG
jgi:hypothetical protein